ncbi:MAG: hypothetical protein KatS3mg082_1418 [Nitrospiraceae bacterium]|nr:MAG: hypothetical protein KatS3mg082_1418 [Nitrospiraceae bacterium]
MLDPYVGSGTTLIAAKDLGRNAVGFDLKKEYVDLCVSRLRATNSQSDGTHQIAVHDDARNIPAYLKPGTVSLIWTSPPYANLLNRREGTNQCGIVKTNDTER